jgi:hypothetical protein
VNPVGHDGRSISSQRVMGVQSFFLVTAVLDVVLFGLASQNCIQTK